MPGREPLYPHTPKSKVPQFPHRPGGAISAGLAGAQAGEEAARIPQKAAEKLWYLGEDWTYEYSSAEAKVYCSADGEKRLYVYWDGSKEVKPRPLPMPSQRDSRVYTHSELADIAKIFYETTSAKGATVFAGLRPLYTRWEDLSQAQRDQSIEGLRVRIEREGLLGYLERKRPVAGDELTDSIIGQLTVKEYLPLAETDGNPISKYCCRQCGDCAPAELLEEGKFLERISWLRRHYKEKHPRMWGKG